MVPFEIGVGSHCTSNVLIGFRLGSKTINICMVDDLLMECRVYIGPGADNFIGLVEGHGMTLAVNACVQASTVRSQVLLRMSFQLRGVSSVVICCHLHSTPLNLLRGKTDVSHHF